jgi:hypothetical protein
MPVNWEAGAFFLAGAAITPHVGKYLTWLWDANQKRSQKILRLKWQDIPDGIIHSCDHIQNPYIPCTHVRPHVVEKSCWESDSSIGTVFNQAWIATKTRPQYIQHVPDAIPASATFICTDARTVLAFILCTAGPMKPRGWKSQLDCVTWKGIQICHIKGKFQKQWSKLQKSELSCMLDGYPPWYRETFRTHDNLTLAFPIRDLRDVRRGGWIIAVGLMDVNLGTQTPLSLFYCEDEPDAPGFRNKGVIFRNAIARCLDHIRLKIQPHFPNDIEIPAAIEMLEYLLESGTNSGLADPQKLLYRNNRIPTLPNLSHSDCKFIMDNFNEYKDLEPDEIDRYRGIMFDTMAAVVSGALEVVTYLKDVGMFFKFPPELEDLDREVYLRDCMTRSLID